MIEVTVPATLRPEVWRRSLDSFARYVADPAGFSWYVHLALVGDGTPEEMMQVGVDFGIEVTWHSTGNGSLNDAMRTLWALPRGEVFLHIEDDVEFLGPVSLDAMLAQFAEIDRLAYLAFRRPGFPLDAVGLVETEQDGAIAWRGGKYRMSFGPGLVSGQFARTAAPMIHAAGSPASR